MLHELTWSDLQRIKKAEKRKKIMKEVLIAIAIAVVFVAVMAVGGLTFPY